MLKIGTVELKPDELQKLPLDQLNAAVELFNQVVAVKQQAEMERFRKEMEARAKKAGIDLSALLREPRKPVPPKYRNPANPAQTWAGRGREPDWFKALDAKGRERALIKQEPVAQPAQPAAA